MTNGGKKLNYEKLNIGLDRCRFVLSSVAIDGGIYRMNIEKGEKAQILDIATGEVIGVSDFDLTIKGISLQEKDDYTIKVTLMKKPNINFVLDVNIPKLLYNTNERNASNLEHLTEVNQIIEKKLSEVGVYTDMTKARVSSFEINVNSTDSKLYDAMKIIRKGFNASNEKVFVVESKNNIESLMVKNRYIKVKVYNKTQQLQDTGQLYENKNLVRVEVTTLDSRTINTITGNDPTIDGIIENWDKVENWFRSVIEKHIKKPCEEYNKAVESAMVEKLKQGHKTYDILISQANKGDLVDLEIFSKAMKRYYKETGKSKPHTVIKNTKNRLERVEKTQYDSLVGNIESLEKLWNGIGL